MNELLPIQEMERAYRTRDESYNGLFFLGVRTTGIFCRPTCPSRKPAPQNVEYFPTAAEALFAGYRACRRCHPLELDDQPAWAKRLLADIEAEPDQRITEADLQERGVDPTTARRHFLRHYGMTFQAFARARRLGKALQHLRAGGRVDDAVFDSGYESHSGFREAFGRLFGEPPGRHRGASVELAWFPTPLGPMIGGATADGVCLLEFSDRRMLEAQLAAVKRLFGCPVIPSQKNELLARLGRELAEYFAGTRREFTVLLTYPGTPFQQRVWGALLKIPYGETMSYRQLAVKIGNPDAQRAVGRTNGLNRIAIVIPCHRVINHDGKLGGYGGGLRRKEFLLALEKRNRPAAP